MLDVVAELGHLKVLRMRYVRKPDAVKIALSSLEGAGRKRAFARMQRAALPPYLYIMRQQGISAEIRAELAGHSLETTMKYSSPKPPEIERAIKTLCHASTI